jgi:hypothetical protein
MELLPHRTGRTAEHGKVDKGNDRTVLHSGEHTALRASRTSSTSSDMDRQRGAPLIVDAEHGHVGQADKQLAHERRWSVTTGVLHLRSLNNLRLVDPRYALADPSRVATPRSIPKSPETLFALVLVSASNRIYGNAGASRPISWRNEGTPLSATADDHKRMPGRYRKHLRVDIVLRSAFGWSRST